MARWCFGLVAAALTSKSTSLADDWQIFAEAFERRSRMFSQPRLFGPEIVYIDNGVIRVGVDPSRGGSIAYLADSKDPGTNVINCHDMGREVQLSYYQNPQFYNPPTEAYPKGACNKLFGGKEWPWNPIGAGDVDGNHGEILSVDSTTTSVHIVTRPLQWACHNVSCECTFEQKITLGGNPGNTGVKIEATLHNSRTDAYTPQARDQELPAVYSNGAFYHLVTYNGSSPFTHAPTVEYNTAGPLWTPGKFPATENWAALVNDNGWGMGVVNTKVGTFLGGFSGKPGEGGPSDPQTGYIAPVDQIELAPNAVYTFTSHLVLGDLATIRSYAYQVRDEKAYV